MHFTESQTVDSHIINTEELKAYAENLKVPTMYWLHKLHNKQFNYDNEKDIRYKGVQ